MIRNLLYLTINKPNIVLIVYLCVTFQANPMESPIKAVNKVIKCVKHIVNFDIWYLRNNILIYLSTSTRSLPDQKVIGRVLVKHVSSLNFALLHECTKGKAPLLSLRRKPKTSTLG